MEIFLHVEEEDVPYEEDVLNNRHSLKSWWRYLFHKTGAPPGVRNMIYERSLKELPGCYKLWFNYLMERKSQLENIKPGDPAFEGLINTFERSLAYMHKYPRIWLEYLSFMITLNRITQTRRTFDRALQSLPITQHDRVWPVYLKWVRNLNIPATAVRVYRRYLKLQPENVEEYIDYLIDINQVDEAAKHLARVINDEYFVSTQNRSKHDLWMQLCDLASKNPEKITTLKVEDMIRSGLSKFTNETGKLWTSLADYYIRLGNFEKARDVYEEGVNTVMSVRDFGQIWDAYVEFEYGILSNKMEEMNEKEESGDPIDPREEEELDFNMARYGDLVERQPILISDVALRQNPHNVNEWQKRIKLFNNPKRIIQEYALALLKTIDPLKATGKLHMLWIDCAKYNESLGRIDEARKVFKKATKQNFKKIDHLATIWGEYVEMELKNKNWKLARELIQKATMVPPHPNRVDPRSPTTQRIFKSIRLWSLYADIEECFGTFITTKAVYEKILDLRIASPGTILNYAKYLEEHNYFEDSFKVYERGVSVFKFPNALDIWLTYINKFIERYGGSKLERLRDLFEQAVETAPPKFSPLLYLLYAESEEKFGLARYAMMIYDRAIKAAEPDIRPKLFNIYIKRATENFGVTRTRQIFEKAIESLPDKYVKDYSLRYANLERRLGEIDRARAIYTHCSQFCPPNQDITFWESWRRFEVKHGNVDTVKEMFRIKRSVQAQFNTRVNIFTDPTQENAPTQKPDTMQLLEKAENVPAAEVPVAPKNEEEIDIDEPMEEADKEEDEEKEQKEQKEQKEEDVEITTKPVPRAVFGSAAEEVEQMQKTQGAKERLKKKQ